MNFIKRKQNTLIFLIVAGLYVAIMLLLYSMHLGNYSLRKIVFMLVIAVSVIMPTDKLPIIIAMLFPLNECIRLSDNSRTILPFIVMIYVVKAFFRKMLKPNNALLFLVPFILFTAMNMISSMASFGSFINPLVTCIFILFAYLMSLQEKNDKLNACIATVFVISSVITVVFSLMYKDLSMKISGSNEYATRMSGFSSPWNFGFCMVLAWFFLATLFEQKKIKYILTFVGSVFFAYYAIASGTRSLLIGMCIVFFYLVFVAGKGFVKNKAIYYSVVFLLIPIVAILYLSIIFKPMIENRGEFYDVSRVELWSYYFDFVKSNIKVFLVGLGCNNLSVYAAKVGMLTAHSVFVEMFVELGVIGSIFYLFLISIIFAKAQKNPFKNNMMIPIILYLTFLFTQGGLSTELLYFLIALACQTYPRPQKEMQKLGYQE
jgi:hypothetical protein